MWNLIIVLNLPRPSRRALSELRHERGSPDSLRICQGWKALPVNLQVSSALEGWSSRSRTADRFPVERVFDWHPRDECGRRRAVKPPGSRWCRVLHGPAFLFPQATHVSHPVGPIPGTYYAVAGAKAEGEIFTLLEYTSALKRTYLTISAFFRRKKKGKRIALCRSRDASDRILIGVSGIPGSGKTTLAAAVAKRVNELENSNSDGEFKFAVCIPMDGYHLSRAQLAAMPDAATAIHRRGAAFTFDAEGFYRLVQRLREPLTANSPTVYAPSFDHAVKDPVADDIRIAPESKVVIFEGLYVNLNREPWSSAAALMDECWFVEVDREIARDRLVKRHVASGIVPDVAAAKHRISSTDFLNADDIENNRLPVQELIPGS